MKKIFTLILSIVLVSVVFAQRGNNGYPGNKNGYDKRNYGNGYDIQRRNDIIARINHEYDKKIFWVKTSSLRMREKKREIRRLENERNDRIRITYARFSPDKKGNNRHWKDGYVIH